MFLERSSSPSVEFSRAMAARATPLALSSSHFAISSRKSVRLLRRASKMVTAPLPPRPSLSETSSTHSAALVASAAAMARPLASA